MGENKNSRVSPAIFYYLFNYLKPSFEISLFLGAYPITLSFSFPSSKITRVGILITSYLEAVDWFSSTLSLATLISSEYSLAIFSTTGATILHGAHQSAQKSTKTGTSDLKTSLLKFPSFTSTGFLLILLETSLKNYNKIK